MKTYIIFITFFVCVGSVIAQSKLIGVWGTSPGENADFAISTDSVYYVDSDTSCKYSVIGDSIFINMGANYIFRARYILRNDSLILMDKLGTETFVRFPEYRNAINSNGQTDFTGYWDSDKRTSDSFSLTITQVDNIITGYHCSTVDNGNFIDCSFEDKSINGIVHGDSALITFISTYCNKPGTAVIKKIRPNQIQWEIINNPDGPFYIPLVDVMDFSSIKQNVLNNSNQDSSIVGSWQSEEDSDIVYVFKNDNKCYIYYLQELYKTSNFTISNTTPQCGITVPIDKYTSYLQLQDVQSNESECYLINGITDDYLSLSIVDRGGVIIYKRIHDSVGKNFKYNK